MKRYKHSKNQIFLLEIMINILLFCVLLIVALNFFISTHTLTKHTTLLHRAINYCDNAASLFESGDGTLESIKSYYGKAVASDEKLFIYLDDDFAICGRDDSSYKVIVTLLDDDSSSVDKVDIDFLTADNDEIYCINACHYSQLTADREVVSP